MTDDDQEKEQQEEKVSTEKAVQTGVALSWGLAPELRPGEERAVPVLWLITFTDVMALMLTFFVMLYSMSVPEEEKWEDMTDAFTVSFSQFESPKWYQGPQDTINIDKLDFSRALDLKYLNALVSEIIEKDEKLENVVIIPQKDRLILSLPTELLFKSGQSEVTVKGKRSLFSLGGPLSRIRNQVEVIGHADPRPIQSEGGRFSSNWELSLSRAANVASVLENVGYVRSIIVRGLSSARYDELPVELSEEERLSLSRRVDIVIMKDDGSQRMFSKF